MVSVSFANEYFATRLNTEAWDDASSITKEKALAQAERELEPYKAQTSSAKLLSAICEQALWLLQGDTRAELQKAGVKVFNIGNVSEQFSAGGRPPTISPQGWAILRGPSGVKAGRLL